MTHPTNMSLKGICDWAEQPGSPRQDPPTNDINADMVDGMHYIDLKADWEAYANTHGGGGGGVVAMGLANFAGNGGYVTIGSAQGMITMPDTNYLVYVVPSADTDSRVGEYWVPEANKGTTSFRVYNDGSATTQFKWAVATRSSSTSTNNAAGGDLSGTYPNPTVAKIQGIAVSTTDPTDGQVLKYVASTGMWTPGQSSSGGGGGFGLISLDGNVAADLAHISWLAVKDCYISAILIGGGGGGGAAAGAENSGGGGGGGVVAFERYPVAAGTVLTIKCGGAGTGTSAYPYNGWSGGASYISGLGWPAVYSNGGGGGIRASSGGAGGTADVPNYLSPYVTYAENGGAGGAGYNVGQAGSCGGGGGGGIGSGVPLSGGDGTFTYLNGQVTGGAGGHGASGYSSTPASGSWPGGGGGGAMGYGGSTANAGAGGGAGRVLFWWD